MVASIGHTDAVGAPLANVEKVEHLHYFLREGEGGEGGAGRCFLRGADK